MMYCHAISHLKLGGKMIGVKDLDAGNNKITKGILLLQPSQFCFPLTRVGKTQQSFVPGDSAPRSNLLYTIFDIKVTPFC